jgi:hypothetical protein
VKGLASLLLLSSLPLFGDDLTEEARSLLDGASFDEAVELIEPEIKRSPQNAELRELLSLALAGLGRLDESAHQLQTAIDLLAAAGDTSSERKMLSRLEKIDPEAKAVRSFWNKTTKLIGESANELVDEEQMERAASLLEGLAPFVSSKEREEIKALLDLVKARKDELDLGKAEQRNKMRTVESKHYKIRAALEEETVEVVADTMDRLFDFYVEIYFDGDASLVDVLIPEKATLYIHATKQEMFKEYPGDAPDGLGGWWQPGQNVVHCYDTSATGGTREELLSTLRHEASHQFMTALCNKGGGWAPAWLNEGTSSFFEGSRILKSGEVLWPEAAISRLRTLSHFISNGGGPGAELVLEYAAPGSYPGEYYCYGWGLMYFMQEYEDPKTLEKVYRPLYSEYRRRITTAGKRIPPLPLFKEIFLGSGSPLGHTDLEDFIADWKKWILKSVRPLSLGNAQRAARIKRANRYLTAVERWGDTKPAESARRREQALNDLDYVCEELDDEEFPDVDLLLKQKEILVLLDKPLQEVHVIERILDAVDRGQHELSKSEYKELEDRVSRLDRKNSVWRLAKSRRRLQAGRAIKILDRYEAWEEEEATELEEEEHDHPFLLRASYFATKAAAALDDPKLETLAKDLRGRCAEAGLLVSSGRNLVAKKTSDWTSIYPPASEALFRQAKEGIVIESDGGAPAGRICTTVAVSGEYEIRGVMTREGSDFGAIHGVVFNGNEEDGWMILGVDYEGTLVLLSAFTEGTRVTVDSLDVGYWNPEDTDLWIDARVEPPITEGEELKISIRVLPKDPENDSRESLIVTLGEREPINLYLDNEMPTKDSYVGLFVKGGKLTLSEVIIEDFQ